MNKEYKKAIKEAKKKCADVKERGAAALGDRWDEFERKIFTPTELSASDLRVKLIGEMVKARREKGISQKELERLSGVRQPIIARIERGHTAPQVDTMIKVLAPLGWTLTLTPIESEAQRSGGARQKGKRQRRVGKV